MNTYTPIPESAAAAASVSSSDGAAPSRLTRLRSLGRKQVAKGVLGGLAAVLLASAAFVTVRAGTSAHYRRNLGAAYDLSGGASSAPIFRAPMRMPAFMPVPGQRVATLAAGGLAPASPMRMGMGMNMPHQRPQMMPVADPMAAAAGAAAMAARYRPFVPLNRAFAPNGPMMMQQHRRAAAGPAGLPAHMQAIPRHPLFAAPRVPAGRFRNPMPASWAPAHAYRPRAPAPAFQPHFPAAPDAAAPRAPVGAPHFFPRV